MKHTDIPTILRQTAPIDQRIAWSGAMSAPGKTVRRRRVRRSDVIGTLIVLGVMALASFEGVLTWLAR
jgi:hypothetical protein